MLSDLTTTNVFLGIMAVVSLLEALAVAGVLVAGFVMFRRMTATIDRIEERHVAPAARRVNAILDDVKGVTSRVNEKAGRIDKAADRMVEWCLNWLAHRWQRPT